MGKVRLNEDREIVARVKEGLETERRLLSVQTGDQTGV